MREALQRWFGHHEFRDGQEEIIGRILAGEDLCVVMPTGAGKSLCYQLPALMRPGYGLVVSPLISLMKDQVDGLRGRGIGAACINSTVSGEEQGRVVQAVAQGAVKILYVAPERFRSAAFQRFLKAWPPALFVVDEAHCISQWGHDFRPDYMALGPAAAELGVAQVCAFTATATPRVREDIRVHLGRPAMGAVVTGFQRPNLAMGVIECRTEEDKAAALDDLLEVPAPTIIYASTRRAAEQVAERLDCICYHAGLEAERRHAAQSRFMTEDCPVLVATNAFGMGIDRPDIRRVIHYNLPGSLEAYYQEAGRAGRDGEPAECTLLFAYKDRMIQEFLIELNNPPAQLLRRVYDTIRAQCRQTGVRVLEMTLTELAAAVPGGEAEQRVGACVRLLEKHGYVQRGYRRGGGRGSLRFLRPVHELRLLHQHESTQRSRFLYRVASFLHGQDPPRTAFGIGDLGTLCGLRHDQVVRVLRALQDDVLVWTPPFSGSTTELLKPDDEPLKIDEEALERKRAFELERLDEVVAYSRVRDCRQRFLVQYFGQDLGAWRCARCDRCRGRSRATRELSAAESSAVGAILTAVRSLDGAFGKARIAAMLARGQQDDPDSERLAHHPLRGALAHVGESWVRQAIEALLGDGYLQAVGQEYPCLRVTPKGVTAAADTALLRLPLPRADGGPAAGAQSTRRRGRRRPPAAPPPVHAGSSAPPPQRPDAALLAALRRVRLDLAGARRVEPYRVLSNAALEALALARPRTPEQAMAIKGIGRTKALSVVPHFLAEMARWDGGSETAG